MEKKEEVDLEEGNKTNNPCMRLMVRYADRCVISICCLLIYLLVEQTLYECWRH